MKQVIGFCEQAKYYVFDVRYTYKLFCRSPEMVILTNVTLWENCSNRLLSSDTWEIYKEKYTR